MTLEMVSDDTDDILGLLGAFLVVFANVVTVERLAGGMTTEASEAG